MTFTNARKLWLLIGVLAMQCLMFTQTKADNSDHLEFESLMCDFDVDLGPDITICQGDPWPVISIPGTIPASMTSIKWYLNGLAFPQIVNPTSITTFSAGTYSVVIEYGNGCVASDAINIIVDQNCCNYTVDLGPDITICEGDSWPVISISGSVPGSMTSIKWYLNGLAFPQIVNPTSITTFSAGTYSVVIEYGNGCVASDAINIIVDQDCCNYTVDLGPDITICDGDPWPVISIPGSVPGSMTSIKWYLNGLAFPQVVNPTSITTFAAGTYSVVIEYGNGCVATDAIVINVVSCPKPCDVSPEFSFIIAKCSYNFTNLTTSGPGTIIGYLWDFGDGTTSTETNPSHVYTSPGGYTVTLIAYYLDENGKCCTRKWGISILVDKVCDSVCKLKSFFGIKQINNSQFILSASPSVNGFTNVVNYSWTVDGVTQSPANPETWLATLGTGSHEICLTVYGLTADGQCCSDTYCTKIEVLKKNSNSILNRVGLFPNPAKGLVTVDFSQIEGYPQARIQIVDNVGNEIYRGNSLGSNVKIDTSTWPKGIYHIKIIAGEDIVYKNLSVK